MAGKPKQKTRPKKGKPIEIPVPKRGDFERLVNRAAKKPAKAAGAAKKIEPDSAALAKAKALEALDAAPPKDVAKALAGSR